jgi:hypothetical protein
VTEKQKMRQMAIMNDLAYAKALDAIRRGHQVMVSSCPDRIENPVAESALLVSMPLGPVGRREGDRLQGT